MISVLKRLTQFQLTLALLCPPFKLISRNLYMAYKLYSYKINNLRLKIKARIQYIKRYIYNHQNIFNSIFIGHNR